MALKTRWQFIAAFTAIVGGAILLMAGSGNPKYVGRFSGDGSGLSNVVCSVEWRTNSSSLGVVGGLSNIFGNVYIGTNRTGHTLTLSGNVGGSIVAGGTSHTLSGMENTIVGGFGNKILDAGTSGEQAGIFGGSNNRMTANYDHAFMGGGRDNINNGTDGVVLGGQNIYNFGYPNNLMGPGYLTSISNNAGYMFITGNEQSKVSGADGMDYGAILPGTANWINVSSSGEDFQYILGGEYNQSSAYNSWMIGNNFTNTEANTVTIALNPDGFILGNSDANRAVFSPTQMRLQGAMALVVSNTVTVGTNAGFAVGSDGSVVSINKVTATNFVFSIPRWTDALATGFAIKLGANAPTLDQSNPDDAEIQSYFYGYGDDARFEVQSAHSLARTNATFPNFYFEPHLHCMTSTTASGTNATFRLKMDVAVINGTYTNVAVYSRTNTTTLTNAYSHYVLSFGNITNNLLQGHNSVLFRGFFERLNGGAGDIGSGTLVAVDSIDIHVPLDQIGSAQ